MTETTGRDEEDSLFSELSGNEDSIVYSRLMILKIAYDLLQNLIKMQILIQQNSLKAQNSACLTPFEVIPTLLVQDHTRRDLRTAGYTCMTHELMEIKRKIIFHDM